MHSYMFLFLKKTQSLNLIQIIQSWCHSTPHKLLYSMPLELILSSLYGYQITALFN